ncbi:MAG: DNA methyltransferase [Elusimicrobia bacterium CG_4_10_14_0_8_um_filter_37_32]|nr:MAG: DNA methyltransferase [Elusimicrobia bacterium CG02_land_8_20_14_3_00_37_13]PIZ14163.1 MAG: DNA methyltransferase [Elusimicrobia bacterium CG_4_10_14_0_8_um_filter_37_32]
MFLEVLAKIEEINESIRLRLETKKIIDIIQNPRRDNIGILNISSNGGTAKIKKNILLEDLTQIADAQTLERAKYYINRLKKGLTEVKNSKINDFNLNRWKEYDDILTGSLWILDKRDKSGAHNAGYWGNFIPQIPNQFLRRYTKQGEWVLDAFLGSGTTLIESKRLGRNGIGVELVPEVVELANKNIANEKNIFNVRIEVINGDSAELNFRKELETRGIRSIQFLIMHPPYWNIIKFSNNNKDLSNAKTIEEFLNLFGKIVDSTYDILDKDRYFAVVIGDKYSKGEWIPLGFHTMNEVLKRGYMLKSIIVKNFEETKGKMNQKELWRYRALVGGFYIFKHEYIFLFKKVKK